ncbi:GNAT family N-acetyltransferase [Gleimia coleocanis]|nr:GNAT family N-acetyltransferase [Gleimia coleocanis]
MNLIPELGFSWRPLTASDSAEFQALANRIEDADGLPYRTSESEIFDLFNDDAHMRCIGGWKDDVLRCYAFVRIREANLTHAMCQGGVDPQYRGIGIGGALVAWLTDTAKGLLETAEVTSEDTKLIEFYVEMGNAELEYHLNGLGYQWRRSFYDLRAPLISQPSYVELNSLFSIEPWQHFTESEILEVENRVSYEQRQRSPQSLATWLAGRSDFKPEWSFVAVDNRADRPVIAGFLMASAYEQDWQVLGWKEGNIDQIAVLEEYSAEPLAEALITATMRAQFKDGMNHTATGLSSTNASGALGIYKNLGFETVATAKLFSLSV